MNLARDHYKYEVPVLLIIVLAGTTLIVSLLYNVGIPKEVLVAIVSGVFTLCIALLPRLFERRKNKQKQTQGIKDHEFYLNPFIAALLAFFSLLFIEACVSIYQALIMSLVLPYAQGISEVQRLEISARASAIGILHSIVGVVFIAKYITHRIKRYPLLWLVGVVLIKEAIDFILGIVFLPEIINLTTIRKIFTTEAFLLVGVLAGYTWARRTQNEYLMRRLFKQLSQSEQKTVIESFAKPSKKWKIVGRGR